MTGDRRERFGLWFDDWGMPVLVAVIFVATISSCFWGGNLGCSVTINSTPTQSTTTTTAVRP